MLEKLAFIDLNIWWVWWKKSGISQNKVTIDQIFTKKILWKQKAGILYWSKTSLYCKYYNIVVYKSSTK